MLFQISCHGIPWFLLTLIAIYLLRSTESREVQINLLFGKLLVVQFYERRVIWIGGIIGILWYMRVTAVLEF